MNLVDVAGGPREGSSGRPAAAACRAAAAAGAVAAVHEGAVIPKTANRSALGGALLTRAMRAVLSRELEAKGSKLMARHMFRRVPIPDFAQFETVVQANPHITPSYDVWGLDAVASEAKEALCKAADTMLSDNENAQMPYAMFELPDGTELNIGPDRFRVTETLFQPARISSFPGLASDPLLDARPAMSWPGLVKLAVDACDGELQRDFWTSIVLTGGTSLLPNARERLERELTAISPSGVRAKVNAPVNSSEKRFATWIGGSILASLPSFQGSWMSRAEYAEHGAGLIHKKSP